MVKDGKDIVITVAEGSMYQLGSPISMIFVDLGAPGFLSKESAVRRRRRFRGGLPSCPVVLLFICNLTFLL